MEGFLEEGEIEFGRMESDGWSVRCYGSEIGDGGGRLVLRGFWCNYKSFKFILEVIENY